ncbi:MAG TPA: DUF1569 domain-containing protein [Chlorobiota bacterium]|nr:DUF1569 domain-containing protein [Chlorobiota bacterium]
MMRFPSVFDQATHAEILSRLSLLHEDSPRLWGTMSAAQMLAHLSVAYEFAYGVRTDTPPWIMRKFVALFFRDLLVGDKPYPKNGPTAPAMKQSVEKDFLTEHKKFTEWVERVHHDGREAFEGRRQSTLGVLTADEWSTLFYKHLDHHFRQFGI